MFWLWYSYLLYLEIYIYIYIPHAWICRKFITNVSHVHNITSQTMSKVYFETFQSLQLTNIVIFFAPPNLQDVDNMFSPPPLPWQRTHLCPCRLCACTIGMPPYLILEELEDHLANHGMEPAQMILVNILDHVIYDQVYGIACRCT